MVQQKLELERIESECRKFLSKNKQPIKVLRNHKIQASETYNNLKNYKKFCAVNQLFLNEHSYFCNCKESTKDNLQIRTNHAHTQIEWVIQFQKLIDNLSIDFAIARYNYYCSLDGTKVSGFTNRIENIKNGLLKNSFKTLYSILDQIAHGVFQVMEIDFENKLKIKFPDEKEKPKLYFLNMWDYGLFDEKHFIDNYYLISLYSITKDFDRSKFSALSEFKNIRNSMEHKIMHIVDESASNAFQNSDFIYKREVLLEKTKILMMLTKSAIYSFTYLIRRQSIYKAKEFKEIKR
jgi:hypothetical protein